MELDSIADSKSDSARQQSVWKTDFFSAKCIRRVVCPGNKNNRIFFGWDACHDAFRQDNRQCFRIFDSDVRIYHAAYIDFL